MGIFLFIIGHLVFGYNIGFIIFFIIDKYILK